jgi:predicted ArsR family transcriptional regulator
LSELTVYRILWGKKVRKTQLDNKFFESTRGKIVTHLRPGPKTVNELVVTLGLTDNAVRANLLTLERDGLVRQSGLVKGFRKPHFAYSLTAEARLLFPKAYDSLLNGVVAELKNRLSPAAIVEMLRTVGRRFGVRSQKAETLEERIETGLAALEELGGAATVERQPQKIVIRGEACPFADVVAEHPEVCQLAEAMVEEIVGEPVKEVCDRNGAPKCCFEITPSTAS